MRAVRIIVMVLAIICFSSLNVTNAQEEQMPETESIEKSTPETESMEGTAQHTTKNEYIMITSATILGFTGLGFILGVKLSDHENILWQALCVTIAYFLVMVEISLHLFIILWASQDELLQKTYEQSMLVTVILVVTILICFALMIWLDAGTRQKKHRIRRTVRSAIKNHGGMINN